MDPLLSTLVLILLALLGARVSFSTERVPAGPRLLFRTGIHFLVLGYLLGPQGLALFTEDAVAQLNPLLALALGWVGLLFGMQLDRNSLRQFPVGYYVLALGQAVITFAVFLAVGWFALTRFGSMDGSIRLLLVGAAATASVTTPAGVALVSANFMARGQVRQLLFFVASLDALVGITALQVAYAVFHPAEVMDGLLAGPAPVWIAVALGLGVVCSIIFLWLVRLRPNGEELVLYLLGISALASGAALQLQLSPLFVCVTMGAVVANLSAYGPRVFQALEKWEKPIYVVLLLLAGALVSVSTWWVVPLAAAYAVVRAVGKGVGTAVLLPVVRTRRRPPATLGLGLVPQGGIALALAVSLVLTYSGLTLPDGTPGTDLLFAVIVLGVVASELAGPFLTVRVLRAAGEITPDVEEAIEDGDEERARAEALRTTEADPPPGDRS